MSTKDFILEIIMLSAFEAILFFQFAYVISQWIFIRRPEYLWYAAYILGMATYTLLIYDYIPTINLTNDLSLAPKLYIDKALPFICYYFYYRFARAFLDMETQLPILDRYIKYLEYYLLVYCSADLLWKVLGQDPIQAEFVFLISSTILFLCSLILIVIFLKKRIKLSYFLVFGAVVITIGSFGTMLLLMREQAGYSNFKHPFLLNNIAVVIELLAFTTGLAYKARLEEIAKVKYQKSLISELENNINLNDQLQNIRKNIAIEIHSEIGENISDISIYSALASKCQNNNPEEIKDYLSKIRQKSLEVVFNMQDFIWTLYPENARLSNLVKKFEQIHNELLRPNKIEFLMKINESLQHEHTELPLDFNRLNTGLFRKICNHGINTNVTVIQVVVTPEFLAYIIPFNENGYNSMSDYLLRFKNRFETFEKIQNDKVEIRIIIPKFSY